MSVDLLEAASAALDDLLPEVVFVGGATVELWITDPAAPPVRPTKDVDVVVEVTSRSAFYDFETRLRAHGFREDREGGVICRWRHDANDLILDAMPSEASILGFENHGKGPEHRTPSPATSRQASRSEHFRLPTCWPPSSKRSKAEVEGTSSPAATSPTSSPWSTAAKNSSLK